MSQQAVELRGSTEMGPTGPKSISWSQVSKYATCGKSYELSYLRPDVEPITHGSGLGGSAVHKAVEEAERNEWWLIPYSDRADEGLELMVHTFVADLTERVDRAGGVDQVTWGGKKTRDYPMGEELQWWLRFGGPVFLKRYRTIRRIDAADGTVLLREHGLDWVEARVTATLDNELGLPISGMIDVVVHVNADGERVIRDWKTGSVLGLHPLQLAWYAWLVEQATEGELLIRVGEFGWLRGTKRETWLRRFDLTELVPLVPEMVHSFARGVVSGYFPIQPNTLCPSCMVRADCPYGSVLPERELADAPF